MEDWIPTTGLGKQVRSGAVRDINVILDNGWPILESEITDTLLPGMEAELLLIGQSKGKFGGGRRRIFRQTQKKTREGNKPRFAAYCVVGNNDGIVGLGYGKARETVPARDKAVKVAKTNLFKIARGSGSWESDVDEPHTVPFRVEGSCGSVKVVLMPAPKGKGLVAEKEIQKILKAAGVSDVWSRTFGQTKNKINLIKATEEALRKLVSTKIREEDKANLKIVYGATGTTEIAAPAAKAASVPELPEVKDIKMEPELSEIKGLGEASLEKLNEAGIEKVEQLVVADPVELSDNTGISASRIEKFARLGKELLGGKK